MLCGKSNLVENETDANEVAQQVADEAEKLYRSGKLHCAEAVLAAVKNQFAPEVSDVVVQMASGFGRGSGAGCICGAISGGTMAFGLVTEGDRKQAAALTKELQEWFVAEYGATCCRTLTAEGKKHCVKFTATAAGKVAQMIQENCRS
jgi:C_GCAxxG_C_C family probable redox protein